MGFSDPVAIVREVIAARGYTTAGTLPVDFVDQLPIVHVYLLSGSEGYVDRGDKIVIDIYSPVPFPGEDAQSGKIAGEVCDALSGPIYATAGTIDEVLIDQVPVVRPWTDEVDMTSMSVLVTHRPKD